MTKLLIIHHYGGVGGGGLSLLHIVDSILESKDDFDIYVYCPVNPSQMHSQLLLLPIQVIGHNHAPLTLNHYSGANSSIFRLNSLIEVLKIFLPSFRKPYEDIINKHNADIVIVNSMTLFWLGPVIKKNGKNAICFHRETFKTGLIGLRTSFIKNILANYFDAVVFISRFDINQLKSSSIKKRLITDKVDFDLYDCSLEEKYSVQSKLGLNSTNFNILFLGGIQKLKGADIILKALNCIKNENVKLIFLQYRPPLDFKAYLKQKVSIKTIIKRLLSMDFEYKILKYIEKNKLWDYINFYPATHTPQDYFKASDIVVFPSTKPHQARPIYEAGASRKPIIITDFKETREYSLHMVNCLTFKKGNYLDLADSIIKLKKDQDLYTLLVEQNFMLAKMNHDKKKLKDEINDLLSSL